MTKPAFKKGDKVAIIKSWDGKGTFYIRRGTVTAWGKKVGRIMLESGDMLDEAIQVGRNLKCQKVVPDASNSDLEKIAIADAEALLIFERQRLEKCLTSSDNENYLDAIRKNLSSLHSPNVKWA